MGKVVSEAQTEPGDPADQDKHLAMFPEELPMWLIRMFSFVGETVLDPFLGSGRRPVYPAALEGADSGVGELADLVTGQVTGQVQ